MGTRGLWGFRNEGKDKLTYNHFDSYPTGLGETVRKFITSHPVDVLRKIASKIELVDGKSEPTEKQIKECSKWTDLSVSNQSTKDWYCLLKGIQSDPELYSDYHNKHYMIDSKDFIQDSLFCEYAYIINLDTEKLEIYLGFQKTPQNNRYKPSTAECKKIKEEAKTSGCGTPFYNCKLHLEVPLSKLKKFSMEKVHK